MDIITPYDPLTDMLYDYSVSFQPSYKKGLPPTIYTNKTGIKPIFKKMFRLNNNPNDAIVDYQNYRKTLRERLITEKTRLIQDELEDDLNADAELYQLRKEQERLKAFQLQFSNSLLSVVANQVASFQQREMTEQALFNDTDLNEFDKQTSANLDRLTSIRATEERASDTLQQARQEIRSANDALTSEASRADLTEERLNELINLRRELEEQDTKTKQIEEFLTSLEQEEQDIDDFTDDDDESKYLDDYDERMSAISGGADESIEDIRSIRRKIGGFPGSIEAEDPDIRKQREEVAQKQKELEEERIAQLPEWKQISERVKADLQDKTNQQISDIVKQLGEYKKIDVKKLGLITPQRGMLKAGKRQEAETFIIETFGMGKQRRLTDILELTGLSSTKK